MQSNNILITGSDLQYDTDVLPYIMGTSTAIVGIYLTESNEYLPIIDAFEKRFINKQLYVDLMERICATGYYVNGKDGNLVLVTGFKCI